MNIIYFFLLIFAGSFLLSLLDIAIAAVLLRVSRRKLDPVSDVAQPGRDSEDRARPRHLRVVAAEPDRTGEP